MNCKKVCKEVCKFGYIASNDLLPVLKGPIIEIGKTFGYDVVENYDLWARPMDVSWTFKPLIYESRDNCNQENHNRSFH